jgi:8-oxo-dGTP pyrophosphatase MutT (NUDIX family)
VIDDDATCAILARLGRALAAPARVHVPLRVESAIVGWLDAGRAARIREFTGVFAPDGDGMAFVSALHDAASRSDALAIVTATLAGEGALTPWRNELYAVAPTLGGAPWFLLERAAARYFGVHTWAAHINGVVRGSTATTMWLARRSADKAIDPGKLDNLVGGGIAAGLSLAETLVKEAWEEAGIPRERAARSVPGGAVHIWRERPDGLQSETIYVHDLWLPADFVPANQDGEASEHRLVSLPEVARLISLPDGPDEVTADAGLVVLDFLLRHGAIASASPVRAGLQRLRHPQAAARRA